MLQIFILEVLFSNLQWFIGCPPLRLDEFRDNTVIHTTVASFLIVICSLFMNTSIFTSTLYINTDVGMIKQGENSLPRTRIPYSTEQQRLKRVLTFTLRYKIIYFSLFDIRMTNRGRRALRVWPTSAKYPIQTVVADRHFWVFLWLSIFLRELFGIVS
jgi:hypothetical protein